MVVEASATIVAALNPATALTEVETRDYWVKN